MAACELQRLPERELHGGGAGKGHGETTAYLPEYKKRVFHGTNKRGFHSCLHPCVDCIKDRFRKFESRGKT